MKQDCENCKYRDIDYIFDEEIGDEYPIYTCEKGNDVSLDYECKDFEEYRQEPYVEKFTECDRCGYLKQCENDGYVINCRTCMDNYDHFVKGRNTYCRKESRLLDDKKLSEIINIANELNVLDVKNAKELLQKAIEQFGDITFKELMKDKINEFCKS